MPLWEYYEPDSRRWLPMTDGDGKLAGNMSADDAEELKFDAYADDTVIRVRAHPRKGTRGVRRHTRSRSALAAADLEAARLEAWLSTAPTRAELRRERQ